MCATQPTGGCSGPQGPNDWLKIFNPFGLDQGGWLEPPTVGINKTRQPEAVLKPEQWKRCKTPQPVGEGFSGCHR
jgi:hypothetical protein